MSSFPTNNQNEKQIARKQRWTSLRVEGIRSVCTGKVICLIHQECVHRKAHHPHGCHPHLQWRPSRLRRHGARTTETLEHVGRSLVTLDRHLPWCPVQRGVGQRTALPSPIKGTMTIKHQVSWCMQCTLVSSCTSFNDYPTSVHCIHLFSFFFKSVH